MRSRQSRRSRRSQRAVIMVQALIVLAALVALVATLAANQRASLEAVQNDLRQRRMELAARSAVQRALTALSTTDTNLVTLNDDWAQMGDSGNTSYSLGNGTSFRMQIVDTSSLINVNSATQAQLEQMPLSTEEVAGLVDWRTTTTTATADGAKDEYYNGLATPYNTKLGPLTTVNELLLIHGWTGNDLYTTNTTTQSTLGQPTDTNGNAIPLYAILTADSGMPNTQASGTARTSVAGARLNARTFTQLGFNQQTAARLAAHGAFRTWQSLLTQRGVTTANATQLLNTVTVKTGTRLTGLINLNTAPQAVLETIPNVTSDLATAIVAQQASGFSTLGAMTSVNGLTGTRLAQVADSFGIGSDTFLVRVYAQSGGNSAVYEVTVGLRASAASTASTTTASTTAATKLPQVVAWNRLVNTTVPTYWGWADQAESAVDAGAQQTTGTSSTTSVGASGSGGATGAAQ